MHGGLLVLMAILCISGGHKQMGNYTDNEFFYKPALGARGATEQQLFEAKLDAVDARLGKVIYVTDPKYGAKGDGVTDDTAAIQSAIAVLGLGCNTIVFPGGTYKIQDDISFPATANLIFMAGAKLSVADGKTVTINSMIEAGLCQIFELTGASEVSFGGGKLITAYPQWWGAVGDGVTDDTAAIRAAINSGCRCLFFPEGSYIVRRSGSEIPVLALRSNLIIRGNGFKSVIKNHPDIDGDSGWWSVMGVFDNTDPIENIVIENLKIDGNVSRVEYDPDYQHQHGIYFSSPNSTISNVTIRNIFVRNTGGDGIYFGKNCRNILVDALVHQDCLRCGIMLTGNGSEDCRFINTYEEIATKTTSETAVGVELNSGHAKGIVIANNYARRMIKTMGTGTFDSLEDVVISGNYVCGRGFFSWVTGLTVCGNVFEEPPEFKEYNYLLNVRHSRAVTIYGNKILATSVASGIFVQHNSLDAETPSNITIKGNIVHYMSKAPGDRYGIFVCRVNRAVVEGNIVEYKGSSNRAGIYLMHVIEPIVVNNMVNGADKAVYGIVIDLRNNEAAYRTVVLVAGNISKSATWDLRVQGARLVARENVCSEVSLGSTVQPWKSKQGNIGYVYHNSVPDYGTWDVGDRVIKSNVTPGGSEGWVCTTAGARASGAWDDATTYNIGDCVTYEGHFYESLINSNLNNQPDTNPDKWEDLGTVEAVFKEFGTIAP